MCFKPVGCISDHIIQKESTLERLLVDGTLFRGGTGHSAHQSPGTACKVLLVLCGGRAQQFTLSYRHHNFHILPQQCLLSGIILEVA